MIWRTGGGGRPSGARPEGLTALGDGPEDAAVITTLRELDRRAAGAVTVSAGLAAAVLQGRRRRRRRVRAGVLAGGLVMAGVGVQGLRWAHGGQYQAVIEPSESMGSTVRIGEQVLITSSRNPLRGDVVVMRAAVDGQDFTLITRVVAVAGDTVACPPAARHSGGEDDACSGLVVNGRRVAEPYLGAPHLSGPPRGQRAFAPVTVPAGRVFVMGDNRSVARDSRDDGPLPVTDVVGVAVRVLDSSGHSRPVPGSPSSITPPDSAVIDPPAAVPPAAASPVG